SGTGSFFASRSDSGEIRAIIKTETIGGVRTALADPQFERGRKTRYGRTVGKIRDRESALQTTGSLCHLENSRAVWPAGGKVGRRSSDSSPGWNLDVVEVVIRTIGVEGSRGIQRITCQILRAA